MDNLKEYPLVLTMDQIKGIEQMLIVEEKPKPEEQTEPNKELQKKVLSQLYEPLPIQKEVSDEIDEEFYDLEKENQLSPTTEIKEKTPQPITIKKVKYMM